MKNLNWVAAIAVLAVGACSDANVQQAEDMADRAADAAHDAADAVQNAADEVREEIADASHGLLNVNTADADDLRSAGISDAAVAAIVAGRPYADMLAVDAALAQVLEVAGREDAYRVMWIPFDLNTASREEILLVPGVGDRMAHEFEEYRPYEAMAEFRREIGKYVDDDEVERLAQYVRVAND